MVGLLGVIRLTAVCGFVISLWGWLFVCSVGWVDLLGWLALVLACYCCPVWVACVAWLFVVCDLVFVCWLFDLLEFGLMVLVDYLRIVFGY